MLPNHAPLVIAEQFGTLDALYPGRIDLGLGRAPGTDAATAHALRRKLMGDVDRFPEDVVELLGYFREPEPGQRVRAFPGAGAAVEVWILGSSLFGAELAAALGPSFRVRVALRARAADAGGRDLPPRLQPAGPPRSPPA